MHRRAFLYNFALASVPGCAGLRAQPAPREDKTAVIMDVDRDTEVLRSSGIANGGTALVLGMRNQQQPNELGSADLIHFSRAGARLTSAPVLAIIGSHHNPASGHFALDNNGALWAFPPRRSVGADAGGGLKNLELVRLEPGEPLRTFPLDFSPRARATAMTCESGVVWCAVISSSIATLLRFQVSSQTVLSRGFNAGTWCYRLLSADPSHIVAAYGLLSKTTFSSSVDLLDDQLQRVASASAHGWIQDAAYTAAAGTEPAKLYLAVTKDMWGSGPLAVETFALPDLRRVSVQTWSELDASVPGSVLFVRVNDTPTLVRMSSATLRVLARALVAQEAERVLPVPPPIRRAQQAYPVRSGIGVRYLLEMGYLVNGRIRKELTLSPDLNAAVRG